MKLILGLKKLPKAKETGNKIPSHLHFYFATGFGIGNEK